MTSPTVSVIVPVYNSAKYLDRCIESVLGQDYTNFELILVNDGSTDNSLVICQHYAESDNRIKLVDKANGGVSSARNAGIELAQGDYLTFIDSDDYISPDFFSNFAIDKGVDFYAQGYTDEYPDTTGDIIIPDECSGTYFSDLVSTMISTGFIMSPWSKLFCRSIIMKHNLRFKETLSYAEDRLFNAEYFHYIKTYKIILAAGYHYTHENANSLTHRKIPAENLYDFVKHYRPLMLNLINKAKLSKENILAARFTYNYPLIQCIITHFKNNDRKSNQQFVNQLPREIINDVQAQNGLPPRYKIVAKLLSLPTPISAMAIKLAIH